MRWENRRRSDNVEDRRGQNASPINAAMGGGLVVRLLPMLLKTKGGRMLLIAGVAIFFGARMLGIDLMPLVTGQQVSASHTPAQLSADSSDWRICLVILAILKITWTHIFGQQGQRYQAPNGFVQRLCAIPPAARPMRLSVLSTAQPIARFIFDLSSTTTNTPL